MQPDKKRDNTFTIAKTILNCRGLQEHPDDFLSGRTIVWNSYDIHLQPVRSNLVRTHPFIVQAGGQQDVQVLILRGK